MLSAKFCYGVTTVAVTLGIAALIFIGSRFTSISSLEECMKIAHTEYLSAQQLQDWKEYSSKGCKKSHCQFMNATKRSIVPLISFPGSGNTWTRGLLEKATGICTGAQHYDMSLIRSGFIGHGVMNGAVIAAKMHSFEIPEDENNLYQALLIMRNPYDTLVAEWQRRHSGRSHMGTASKSDFIGSVAWNNSVKHDSRKWSELAKTTIERSMSDNFKLHIIRYERLQADKITEIEGVLQFLGFNYNTEDLRIKLQADYVTFKRSHSSSAENFDHFTASQMKIMNERILDLIQFVRERNFKQLDFLTEYIDSSYM